MRYLFALILCLLAPVSGAQDWEDRQRFGPADASGVLRVLSSTDTALFEPLLRSFVAVHADTAIDYFVASTSELDQIFRQTPEAYDVVISSAMDLQFKLANDGFARPLEDFPYPGWAQWRRSLFAFTSEPAAIVINRGAFAGLDIPHTRQELIRVLRDHPTLFQGRVGTYDVRQSGVGYLFATQDARTSETYWRLMEVMGGLQTQLYCCSGEMIEDVARGQIAVAYNVLASYAVARADLTDKIEVIVPSDFQTIMMRTALVSAQTQRPAQAQTFVAHLLRQKAAAGGGSATSLPGLDLTRDAAGQSTIPLEPALLTYLDTLKSAGFFKDWTDAIIQ